MSDTTTQTPMQQRTQETAGPPDAPSGESGLLEQTKKWGQVARKAQENCSNANATEQLDQRRQTSAQ